MRVGWCALLLAGCALANRKPAGNAAGFGAPVWRGGGQGVPTLAGGVVSPAGDLAFVVVDQLALRPGFAPLWTGGTVVSLTLAPLAASWRLPLPGQVRLWDWAPAAHALWASRLQGLAGDEPSGLFALRPGGMIEPPQRLGDDSCGRVVPVLGGTAVVALADGGGALRYWRREYADFASAPIVPGPAVPSCSAIELAVDRDRVAALVPMGTAADPRYGIVTATLASTGRLDAPVSVTVAPSMHPPELRLTADVVSPDGRWLAMRAEGTGQLHEIVFDTGTGARLADARLPDTATVALFVGDSLVIGRESGFTRIDLPAGHSVDHAVPGCCQRVDRVPDTDLVWAHGVAGGMLLGEGGRMAPLDGGDGRFRRLGGDLYDLVGAEIRRTRLGDLTSERWPRPARVDLLIGVEPLAGRLVLAGLDGGALHVVLWSPEHGQVDELRLPLARVIAVPDDDRR